MRQRREWKRKRLTKAIAGRQHESQFFLRFCRTWTKRYLITSQTRVLWVSRIHHRTIVKRVWPMIHLHPGCLDRRLHCVQVSDGGASSAILSCIQLKRLSLECEVIMYRLVQVRQNLKKKLSFEVQVTSSIFGFWSKWVFWHYAIGHRR